MEQEAHLFTQEDIYSGIELFCNYVPLGQIVIPIFRDEVKMVWVFSKEHAFEEIDELYDRGLLKKSQAERLKEEVIVSSLKAGVSKEEVEALKQLAAAGELEL